MTRIRLLGACLAALGLHTGERLRRRNRSSNALLGILGNALLR